MLKFAIIRVSEEDPGSIEVLMTADVEDALAAASAANAGFGRRKLHAKRARKAYKRAVDVLHQQTITLP